MSDDNFFLENVLSYSGRIASVNMTPEMLKTKKIAKFNHRQAFVASILGSLHLVYGKMLNYVKTKCLLAKVAPLKEML